MIMCQNNIRTLQCYIVITNDVATEYIINHAKLLI